MTHVELLASEFGTPISMPRDIAAPDMREAFFDPIDGLGSTIEARLIRDVSLTTRVTQSATLHDNSSLSSRHIKCKRVDSSRHGSLTMKQYKPLCVDPRIDRLDETLRKGQ